MTMPANNPFAPFVGPFTANSIGGIVDSGGKEILIVSWGAGKNRWGPIANVLAARMNDTEPRYTVGEIFSWLQRPSNAQLCGNVLSYRINDPAEGITAFTANKEGKT